MIRKLLKKIRAKIGTPKWYQTLDPLGHWTSAPIVRNPTSRHTISFRPRNQHGGSTYIPNDVTPLTAFSTPQGQYI